LGQDVVIISECNSRPHTPRCWLLWGRQRAMIRRAANAVPTLPPHIGGNPFEDHLMANKWLLVAPVASALGVGAGLGTNELFAAGEASKT
jgi:hypothetical protein